MQYIRFTEEQKEQANSIDLAEFLRMRGETIRQAGRTCFFVYEDAAGKHDSISISGSRWFDHKNGVGGGPVQFMKRFYGMEFQEAMTALLGGTLGSLTPPPAAKPPPKIEFVVPERNANMKRVYAYLMKNRFIAPEIISHFAHAHTLYEDAKFHNAVFLGLDENGVPRQAHKRSTTTVGKSFRMTCGGSDTRYSFSHFGTSPRIYVFEAPIDMLSFLTLFPNDWQQHSYIALNGVYEHPLLHALEVHPNLQEIILCTDNDAGGIDGADRIRDILCEKGYGCVKRFSPSLKDWNEVLKYQHGAEYIPAEPHPRLQAFLTLAENLQPEMCAVQDLPREIHQAHHEQNFPKLAGLALAGSAFFLQRGGYAAGFEQLRQRMKSGYRPYADKACMEQKMRNLRQTASMTLQALRQTPGSQEQYVQMAKQLFDLGEASVKVSTEEALTTAPVCVESEEEAPAMAYG
ncbi:MAG: DUF3991 and TOPRIM domain-containing protein [Oscillospiraceae bacterium]|nr:DUF3991 and TOPRIM domain-containing protein [Oscillospiraceae bacterium]